MASRQTQTDSLHYENRKSALPAGGSPVVLRLPIGDKLNYEAGNCSNQNDMDVTAFVEHKLQYEPKNEEDPGSYPHQSNPFLTSLWLDAARQRRPGARGAG
jgi:hypothetical protein